MKIRIAITLFSLSTHLSAQAVRSHEVPLKNWPAPLYWQPSQTEAPAAGVSPRVQSAQPQAASGPLVFVAMTPCRVVDTRASQNFPSPFGAPSLTPGAARTFTIQTSTLCSIPATAQAYSFNVTVIPPGPLGYLTVYPHGQPTPNAVTLDDLLGTIANNAAIVPAGAPSGAVDVVVNANTDLVLDINGFYAASTQVDLGSENTATGFNALVSNTSGTYDTANGFGALFSNTSGSYNTAEGSLALYNNTGSRNTASGYGAMYHNAAGSDNTAVGYQALINGGLANGTSAQNTALGSQTLQVLENGSGNTAIGYQAGFNTNGNGNIAIGNGAGGLLGGHDSSNIDIGNFGRGGESGVIRIGDNAVQGKFFAAGVRAVTPDANNGVPVYIDSDGQMGTAISSRRFKEDIQDMADASSDLLRLRPVTYRYQKPYADGSKPIDYGLIAEEVAEVYPGLVVKNKDGQVETVQYQKLTPMLLNELQKLEAKVAALQERLDHAPSGPSPITQ